jgi:spermidine synthase
MSQALGRHILAEYYEAPAEWLDEVVAMEQAMLLAAQEADATIIASSFHHFSPHGVSGVVVIQESHLTIHTWPELGYAAVDIFTCGEDMDPWVAYASLKKGLKANQSSGMELLRGQGEWNQSGETLPQAGVPTAFVPAAGRQAWFTTRNTSLALSLRHEGRLHQQHSPYQKIEVYDTLAYGRLLALDGQIVSTEGDEYIYHEMLTHVAMQTLDQPQTALVIGGGDGGAARELLRYDSLTSILVVEIDEEVRKVAQQFLPTMGKSLDDPRVDLRHTDAWELVQQTPAESLDLLIVDAHQAIGHADGFQATFLQQLYQILRPQGVLILQTDAPRYAKQRFSRLQQAVRQVFGAEKVFPYLTYLPTYPTGTWSFAYASKGDRHPLHHLQVQALSNHGLRYYNEGVHRAAFALPNDIQAWLREGD